MERMRRYLVRFLFGKQKDDEEQGFKLLPGEVQAARPRRGGTVRVTNDCREPFLASLLNWHAVRDTEGVLNVLSPLSGSRLHSCVHSRVWARCGHL